MLFDYLMDRIQDPYVKDELRKWTERWTKGIQFVGHKVETLSRSNGVRISFVDKHGKGVAVIISDEQAQKLSLDLGSVLIEKRMRR